MTKGSLYRGEDVKEKGKRQKGKGKRKGNEGTRDKERAIVDNSSWRLQMSARNGDKSRYQINRKRAVHRRAKIRQLIKSVRSGPAQAAKATK
jgi:hypothetical protein